MVDGDISSFGELLAASNPIAHGLRAAGLQPGDSVSVVLHNDPSFIEVYLAAMGIGLYITPIRTSRASRGRPLYHAAPLGFSTGALHMGQRLPARRRRRRRRRRSGREVGRRSPPLVEPAPGLSPDGAGIIEYKAPKSVHLVDSIGRAPNGKVDDERWRQEAQERVRSVG